MGGVVGVSDTHTHIYILIRPLGGTWRRMVGVGRADPIEGKGKTRTTCMGASAHLFNVIDNS